MREDLRVSDPATWIAILLLDQRAHRLRSIAEHACRHALGARDDLAIHHEHAVIVAERELLDHHALAERLRDLERGAQRLHVIESPRDAAAMARVEGLDD